jgi:hypothetical protein
MSTIWPFISFLLGALLSLFVQWISYRLSFKKDQKKEYWIRKLNSYQDFCQHINHLADLLRTGILIPDTVFWQSILFARKAAFDAEFFDWSSPERPKEMQGITNSLISLFQSKNYDSEVLNDINQKIERIILQFYEEEKLSWKTSYLSTPNR